MFVFFVCFFTKYFPYFLISENRLTNINTYHTLSLDKFWTFWLALLVSFFWFGSHCSLFSLSFPFCSFLLKPSADKEQIISLICRPWTNEKTPIVTFDFMLHWLGLLISTMAFLKRNRKRKTQQLSFAQNFIKSVSITVQKCRKWENSFHLFIFPLSFYCRSKVTLREHQLCVSFSWHCPRPSSVTSSCPPSSPTTTCNHSALRLQIYDREQAINREGQP